MYKGNYQVCCNNMFINDNQVIDHLKQCVNNNLQYMSNNHDHVITTLHTTVCVQSSTHDTIHTRTMQSVVGRYTIRQLTSNEV